MSLPTGDAEIMGPVTNRYTIVVFRDSDMKRVVRRDLSDKHRHTFDIESTLSVSFSKSIEKQTAHQFSVELSGTLDIKIIEASLFFGYAYSWSNAITVTEGSTHSFTVNAGTKPDCYLKMVIASSVFKYKNYKYSGYLYEKCEMNENTPISIKEIYLPAETNPYIALAESQSSDGPWIVK